jgi:cytochrome b
MKEAHPDVLVWDVPVRLFHWLLVASFAGAYVTAESERWHAVHVTLGWTVAGLVVFRLLWGWVGSRHARFGSFVRGPGAALRYLRSLVLGRPHPHAGHNPAGALVIVALLALALGTAALGWLLQGGGGHWVKELHEGAANTMLAIVGIHVLGVVVGSIAHRENLVRAMLTGRKRAAPSEGIRARHAGVAVVLLALVTGFWAVQWHAPIVDVAAVRDEMRGADNDRDDD